MSVRTAGALLICSLLAATNVCGKSIQNYYGGPNVFSSQIYSAQQANIIGFNNRNRPFPHSVNNFNPLSSSLVSSSQSFYSNGISNRQPYPPSAFYGRPLPINQFHGRRVPRIPAAQSSGGSLNAGAISFGWPAHTPVSFSNKPTQSFRPLQPTNGPRVPISFGGGPVIFPGSSPSISNKPIVTNSPNFSGDNSGPTKFPVAPTTDVNLDPTPTKGSPPILFPGDTTIPVGGASVTESIIPNIHEDSNCMLKHGTVYFNGNCEILLSRASCPEDHWLLIDVNGSPYCAERQCPWGQLHFFGDCVDPGDHQRCNRGQILYVDFTGVVECDCEPDFVFNSASGNCYGIHEQGFCDAAMYLERDDQGNVVCVPNPCISDKYVEKDGVCYEKNYRGYCPQSQVSILPQVVTADCEFIVPHSIFEVQTLTACPDGSQRAFFDKCRGVLRVPSQSTFPTSRGDCPPDFVKDPRGTCRKVINLFG